MHYVYYLHTYAILAIDSVFQIVLCKYSEIEFCMYMYLIFEKMNVVFIWGYRIIIMCCTPMYIVH